MDIIEEEKMGQNALTKCIMIAAAVSALVASGCGKKEKEITQGITPNVLNFYILHQEIGAIRDKAGSAEAVKLMQYLPAYRELTGRGQKMLSDNAVSKELKKYPEINAAMDTCLKAGMTFLDLEAKAIETYANLTDIRDQLAEIRRAIKHNSLLAKKQKTKIDELSRQEAQASKKLEGYKQGLARGSQTSMSLLKAYNDLILQGKILEYANDEKLYAGFSWEKPSPAPKLVKKTVKKKKK